MEEGKPLPPVPPPPSTISSLGLTIRKSISDVGRWISTPTEQQSTSPSPMKRAGWKTWLRQVRVLTWKNLLFTNRNILTTAISLLAPVALMIILWYLASIMHDRDDTKSSGPLDSPKEMIGELSTCQSWNKLRCVTLLYSPNTDSQLNAVMATLAAELGWSLSEPDDWSNYLSSEGLDLHSDAPPLPDIIGLPSATAVFEFIQSTPNVTQAAITWDPAPAPDPFSPEPDFPFIPFRSIVNALPTLWSIFSAPLPEDAVLRQETDDPTQEELLEEWSSRTLEMEPVTIASNASYTMWYNSSCGLVYDVSSTTSMVDKFTFNQCPQDIRTPLTLALDQALLSTALGPGASVSVTVGTRKLNVVSKLLLGTFDKVASAMVGIAMVITGAVSCVFIIQYLVVVEKDRLIRRGLWLSGLWDSTYWASWLIFGLFQCGLSVGLMLATARWLEIGSLYHSDLGVQLMVYGSFLCATLPFMLVLSMFFNESRTVVYAALAVLVVSQIFDALFGLNIGYVVYDPKVPSIWASVLSYIPIWELNKILHQMSWTVLVKPLVYPGVQEAKDTAYVSWDIYYNGDPLAPYPDAYAPTIAESVGHHWKSSVFWMVILWYLDGITANGHHGPSRRFWFPLSLDYWRSLFSSREDETLLGEDEKHCLIVKDLVKVYKGKGELVKAVNGVSLRAESGQVLAVLGQNGAGKTTTLSVATGVAEATEGFVRVLGVPPGLAANAGLFGMCPQHDILWDELTAREHIQLFGVLKGLDYSQLDAASESALDAVGLGVVANARVGSFSGGMKRRLSVAIATGVGSPRLVVLDEPTTGMDPVSRKSVWSVIRSAAKDKGRVVVLTTHSMEEAERLGDRVAIMATGKVVTEGTSLALKTQWAPGYRLTVGLATGYDVKALNAAVAAVVPGVGKGIVKKEDESSGGRVSGLWVSFKLSSLDGITSLLQALEESAAAVRAERKTKLGVKEWSVSPSDLEDVFLATVDASK